MRQYRLALLRREFPFLDGIAEMLNLDVANDVNDIKIKRGDKNLLMKKGSYDSYSWSWGGHHDYTTYFSISFVGEIYEFKSGGHSATGSGERHEWEADPISDQIFAQNLFPVYVVECVQNDVDDNGNGEVTRFWTIFKMPGFDLARHLQEKIDEVAAVLKAEIAAACAEEV